MPDTPTVEPSEPEVKERIKEYLPDFIKELTETHTRKFHLSTILDYLHHNGLDVDNDGFIVFKDTREYSTPYVFCRNLVREHAQEPDETLVEAFFRPVTHEDVHGFNNERLHLSDIHTIVESSDGTFHPVRDSFFDVEFMYGSLETAFPAVTAWSSVIRDSDHQDEARNWLEIKTLDSDTTLQLNCSHRSYFR